MIEQIATEIGVELRRYFPHRADLCVLASKIGRDVYAYFGIEAKPVTVRALAYNERWRVFAKTVTTDRGVDLDDEGWERACDEGAWSVVIDEHTQTNPGKFAGHVVLLLPEHDRLADLSLRQFARPDYDMLFPDVGVFTVDADAFWNGEPCEYQSVEGGYIAYKRRPGADSWRSSGDWSNKNRLTGRIIRRVREEQHA